MKLQKKIMFVVLLLIAVQRPAFAQVDKVAMKTARLGCGLCAVFSEIYLKQLGTIDKIQISKSQEAVMITYKAGASFQPSDLRGALKKTEVSVTQIQISARGRVQEQGGKRLFLAGKDRFVLVTAADSPKISVGSPVSIEGVVNDGANPMELRVLTVKPLQQ